MISFSRAVGVLALLGAWLLTGPATAQEVKVYKSPSCGCCQDWVEHMQAEGFEVTVANLDNVDPIKRMAGVPPQLQSCHTAFVDGYIIEGHVPAADVKRLLDERPSALGLSTPGMPIGSPGMEQGDRKDPYNVILFGSGNDRIWSRQNQ